MTFPQNLQHIIRHDEPLAPFTWLKIGGPARYFAEPNSREELIELVKHASENEIPVRVLGGGANLLVRESGFDGLVLSLAAAVFAQIEVQDTRVIAGGGARLSHLVTTSVGQGLSGLGHLIGIPGTIGGALQGNASAGGNDIASAVASIELLSSDGKVETRDRDALQFSYRQSDLGEHIVLSATFELEKGDTVALTKRLQKLWIVRRNERPQNAARIVTPFIDPDGASATDLIENAGLKGARQGGASLDPNRPSFLIADEEATSDDVLALIVTVREKVSLQTGVDLQVYLKIW